MIQVLCSLADLYCDLAEVYRGTTTPIFGDSLKAVRLLMAPEIKKTSTKSKAFRRLLVSTIEINIQQHRYEEARKTIKHLKEDYGRLVNLDFSDQLLHVRVMVAIARISQVNSEFDQAIEEWKTILAHVRKYASFEGEGFTYAVIYISLSLAYFKIGDQAEAWFFFQLRE